MTPATSVTKNTPAVPNTDTFAGTNFSFGRRGFGFAGIAAAILGGVATMSGCEEPAAQQMARLPQVSVSALIDNPKAWLGQEIAVKCKPEFIEDRSTLVTPTGSTTDTTVKLDLELRYKLVDVERQASLSGMQSSIIPLKGGNNYSLRDIPQLSRGYELNSNTVMVAGHIEICPFNGKPALVISKSLTEEQAKTMTKPQEPAATASEAK